MSVAERAASWPAHWEVARLEDITTKVTSGSRDWKPYYGRGNGVFILSQNVRMRSLDLTDPFRVGPPADDPARERSAVRQDDILVNIVGAVGTVARVPQPLDEHYVCQSVALVRPALPAVSRWLELYLAAPTAGQAYFREKTYGLGRPHLNFADIKAMPVPLPPLDEQEALVAEADRLLVEVASGEESFLLVRRALKLFQRAVLHSAYYGDLAGGPFPECSLGEVCDVRAGIGFPKGLQGRTGGDMPFAKVRDISRASVSGQKLLRHVDHFVSHNDVRQLKGRPFPVGSVVMAKIGEAVRLNRRVVLARDSLVDNNVMGWVPDPGQVSSDYLYYFSRTVDLGTRTQETAVPSVRKSEVVRLSIPLPDLRTQQRVVAVIERQLSGHEALVTALERAAREAQNLRAAILGQAIAGAFCPASESDGILDALKAARRGVQADSTRARSARRAVAAGR